MFVKPNGRSMSFSNGWARVANEEECVRETRMV